MTLCFDLAQADEEGPAWLVQQSAAAPEQQTPPALLFGCLPDPAGIEDIGVGGRDLPSPGDGASQDAPAELAQLFRLLGEWELVPGNGCAQPTLTLLTDGVLVCWEDDAQLCGRAFTILAGTDCVVFEGTFSEPVCLPLAGDRAEAEREMRQLFTSDDADDDDGEADDGEEEVEGGDDD